MADGSLRPGAEPGVATLASSRARELTRRSLRTGLAPVLFSFRHRAFAAGAFCVLAALFDPARSAQAQFVVRSWLPWRTIETRHFVFHYPEPLEAWTRHIAARADAIDSAVAQVAGYAPTSKTNIVVDDPYSTANGSAWPFIGQPIINLWAHPPDPRDDIGEFRDWGEMLVSHEFGHIAHLSRPSRAGGLSSIERLLPIDVGPIALRAPRWVIEGYATFIEGRVTGSGRPHGVWRPSLLRALALDGQLPRYESLDASGAFEGGAYAYLAGSAFLEWLADQRGDSSLILVWRRLTARQPRTFDDAFRGVFGETPATLYGRFTVDITRNALAAKAAIAATSDTGAVVQRLAWYTGDPAISPDGKRIAIVLRSQLAPPRLVVWGTAAEPDTGRARRDSILIAHDPLDVPARAIYPPAKRVLASLRPIAGSAYESPRFLRDGRIVVSRNTAHGDGSYLPDLYLWDVAHKSVRRVTHGAGLTNPDPLPDGRSAVATRCVSGWCDLVTVDLESGALKTVAVGGPDESYYRPRVSPTGALVAVSMHSRIGWRAVTVDLATGARSPIASLENVDAYDLAWHDATSLVVTTEATGVPQLERVDLATQRRSQLTNSFGAAVAAEPNPADGSVWFIALYSRGYDLRSTGWSAGRAVSAAVDAALTPAAMVPSRSAAVFGTDSVTPPRPFGLGPRLALWIPIPRLDADGVGGTLVLTSRDLIARSALTLQGTIGEPAVWRGVSASAQWLGSRPAVRLDAFRATERSSTPGGDVGSVRFDSRLVGGDAMLDGLRSYDAWALRYRVGGSVADLRLGDANAASATASTTRSIAFADMTLAAVQRGGSATFSESIALRGAAGRAFGTAIQRGLATASLSMGGRGVIPFSVSSTYGRTNSDAPSFDQFAVGGGPIGLIPSPVMSQRLPMPALPSATAIGPSVFTYRASLDAKPLAFYWWAGGVAPAGSAFTRWQRVIGAEWSQSVGAIPMAGTPPARAQFGIGESLDAPVRHRFRIYGSLVIDP